ncbi:MAG: HDOD domain-containing protein [Armatimonadetes bacterium]|nr:HDOD domain-containing protein [Armatimonadota bacterium]
MSNLESNGLLQAYVDKAMVDIPSLPTVIVEVVEAIEREGVSSSQIEEIVALDAAITVKLLKVVNSAYFGLPQQISSISQAISFLGLQQVRNLVLSIGVLNALRSDSPRLIALQREFWEKSFGTATCASHIAARKGMPPKARDLVFVSGLLHDIGQLFLITFFTSPYMEVLQHSQNSSEPLIEIELRVLRVTHAEIGGVLAEKWNFPVALQEVIANHEEPKRPTDEPVTACVHCADRLVGNAVESAISSCGGELSQEMAEWLNLTDEEKDEVRADVQEQILKAKELLGMIA